MAATMSQSPSVTHTEARAGAADYLNSRLSKSSDATKPFEIPIIDISPSFSSSLADRKAVAAKIHAACTSSGFFHITGHGVPETSRNGILTQAAHFFNDLSPAQKEALHVKHSRYMFGWEPSTYSYVNPADWETGAQPETKEGFNWGYEASLDPTGGDGQYRNLDGSDDAANNWPSATDLPNFFPAVQDYYGHVLRLARHLFRLFALSLDLEESYFDAMTTHPGGIARILYYAPAKNPKPFDPDQTDEEVGLGAHTDYECFTLLLSSATPGLEILSPEGVWTPSPAVEGSFIVNVADFMMRWTNDRYKSTVHRVVNRTSEPRYSVPFFFSINYDEVVETLPGCVKDGETAKYKPIRAGEYILQRLLATTKEG
ncbi:hypothetical protein MBLNU457_g0769t1 [Dothideomycetes sp. NU457]